MAALVHRQGGLTGQSWLATAVTALRRGRPRWARDSMSVTRPRLRTAQYSHGTHSDSTPVRAGVQHSSRDRATDRTVRLGAARAAQHSGASMLSMHCHSPNQTGAPWRRKRRSRSTCGACTRRPTARTPCGLTRAECVGPQRRDHLRCGNTARCVRHSCEAAAPQPISSARWRTALRPLLIYTPCLLLRWRDVGRPLSLLARRQRRCTLVPD